MNKLVLMLIFLLTIKDGFSQGLELELNARPALTSLRGNDAIKDNYDPTVNFSAGIGVNYLVNDNSIITLTILYDKKGGQGKSAITYTDEYGQVIGQGTATFEGNFDYLTLPIQWGYRFGQKVKYQFGIGFYTSFLLQQESIVHTPDGVGDTNQNNTADFKAFDVGLTASFNVFIPLNKKLSFKTGLDNNLGLVNVSDVPVVDDGSIKHNSFALVMGLNYRIN